MSDKTPQPILTGRAVAAAIRDDLPADAVKETERLLPRLAMAFHQAGHDGSFSALRQHAFQGVKHLRAVLKQATQDAATPPDYERIVAGLNLPIHDRVEEQHLSAEEKLIKALEQNNLDLLRDVIAAHAVDMTEPKMQQLVGEFAVDHRNIEMLEYVLAESERQAEVKETLQDDSRQKILKSMSRKSIMTRDVEGVSLLHQAGMDLDLIYYYALRSGADDVLEFCRQKDPQMIDRHRKFLVCDDIGLGTLCFPYILSHLGDMDSDERNAVFDNFLDHCLIPSQIGEMAVRLQIAPDRISGKMAEMAARDHVGKLQNLVALGGDLTHDDHAVVKIALGRGDRNVLYYLEESGVDLQRFAAPGQLDQYRVDVARRLSWTSVHGHQAPPALIWDDPARYYKSGYEFALKALGKEGYSDHRMAWHVSVLLQTDRRIAGYLQRWGTRDKHPLFSMIYDLKVPQEPFDAVAWGDAVLEHGPEMMKMVKWAHHLPQPYGSVRETRLALAPFMYERASENRDLALLCASLVVAEDDFSKALDLYQKQQAVGFPAKNIPDLSIEGDRFNMPGARFARLPADDPRGLFLGELIGCCQSIGSEGEACAENGFTSPDAGFYVIENQDEIVACIWAWRGQNDQLVFDSLENKRNAVTSSQWQSLLNAVRDDLRDRNIIHDVSALLVGQGGNTPQDMGYICAEPAQPKDHPPYEDSLRQYQVWCRDDDHRKASVSQRTGFLRHEGLKP